MVRPALRVIFHFLKNQDLMYKHLAGFSFLITIGWIIAVISIMWFFS